MKLISGENAVEINPDIQFAKDEISKFHRNEGYYLLPIAIKDSLSYPDLSFGQFPFTMTPFKYHGFYEGKFKDENQVSIFIDNINKAISKVNPESESSGDYRIKIDNIDNILFIILLYKEFAENRKNADKSSSLYTFELIKFYLELHDKLKVSSKDDCYISDEDIRKIRKFKKITSLDQETYIENDMVNVSGRMVQNEEVPGKNSLIYLPNNYPISISGDRPDEKIEIPYKLATKIYDCILEEIATQCKKHEDFYKALGSGNDHLNELTNKLRPYNQENRNRVVKFLVIKLEEHLNPLNKHVKSSKTDIHSFIYDLLYSSGLLDFNKPPISDKQKKRERIKDILKIKKKPVYLT